jgi:hypothetical protein
MGQTVSHLPFAAGREKKDTIRMYSSREHSERLPNGVALGSRKADRQDFFGIRRGVLWKIENQSMLIAGDGTLLDNFGARSDGTPATRRMTGPYLHQTQSRVCLSGMNSELSLRYSEISTSHFCNTRNNGSRED